MTRRWSFAGHGGSGDVPMEQVGLPNGPLVVVAAEMPMNALPAASSATQFADSLPAGTAWNAPLLPRIPSSPSTPRPASTHVVPRVVRTVRSPQGGPPAGSGTRRSSNRALEGIGAPTPRLGSGFEPSTPVAARAPAARSGPTP